jgi:CarD family transcriptional regulator
VKGRGATASHRAAPRRAPPAPAKPAQAVAARKTAAPTKPAKPAADKIVAKPAAKAPPAPAKAAPEKPEAKPAVVAPAAAMHSVQPKPPPAPPRPVPAAAAAVSARPATPDRPPPRPMAKAEIFVEGDHVVYPTHGVGKVERIATEEIAGHKLELIHITFEENRMTLRVPVAKARTAGLRKLATRKLFDEALAVLKGRARIKRTMWSRRAQEYEAKINSGDPLAIAEVVRDLHRNSGQPDQSFSERQIYEAAMDRLAAELAALDKTDKLTAATKLANFLKTV